jgi:Domain of unknown function (DUF389)
MGVALSILGNNSSGLVGVAISASLLPPAVNAGICWARAILIATGAVDSDSDENFALIGAISFSLTAINIVCIWGSGMFMFALKEVAPTKSISAFWCRDIKIARAVRKGGKKPVDMAVVKEGIKKVLKTRRKAARKIFHMLPSKKTMRVTNLKRNIIPKKKPLNDEDDEDGRYVRLEWTTPFPGVDHEHQRETTDEDSEQSDLSMSTVGRWRWFR